MTSKERGRDAFEHIQWSQLPEADWPEVSSGRRLVRQTWVIAPSDDVLAIGLGPTYNRPSCLSCHPRNGRGEPPSSALEPMRSMLVRLSIPGRDVHGGPKPEPSYGEQFNEFGVPGVPGEGVAGLSWETHVETLADGEQVELRRPVLHFRDLAFGPLHLETMHSLRIASPLIGLGLLEAVPEGDILALAEAQRVAGAGVAGVPNRVFDHRAGRTVLGRFGWKANQPTVRQQIAAALIGDMGITTDVFPEHDCPPAQTACAAVAGEHPEVSTASLDAMTAYHFALGVPARRDIDDPEVRRGEAVFAAAGCASCHVPELRTGPLPAGSAPAFPVLAEQTIHPYTDLLLHDMGDELADGRPDFEAGPRHWRTAPLWGIGLAEIVGDGAVYLHDGRARSLLEAILWHGGEAAAAREAVRALATSEREALLAFLRSL
ncbi:di-heme oxidoreductase family protein [Thauera sp. SDU_THAU2]|uniref:di-heme oxidoreductase family protein n=1 Tax=Thauera sp. SDU_THAU2 TaxID=3136633 RepID=UPI00312002BC